MRIRKNKKVAQLGLPSDANRTTPHVCQLNQSPWDVPSTTTTTSSSSHHHHHHHHHRNNSFSFRSPLLQVVQVEEQDMSFTANGSLADSAGAVNSSVASMDRDGGDTVVVIEDDYDEDDDNGNGGGIGLGRGERSVLCCNKSDGKGWQCKKAAKHGHSMCDHHLNQLRSYGNNHNHSQNHNSTVVPPPPSKKAAGSRRGRGRPSAKKVSANSNSNPNPNPYEFYYYSGFGPSWGKKRRDKPEASNKNVPPRGPTPSTDEEDEANNTTSSSSSSDGGGRKRMRKPVKERSLKSLM